VRRYTTANYTEEQIKKALEKCLFKSVFGECEDCAFDGEKPCIPTLVKNVFDLINYQEAKIERLRKENAVLAENNHILATEYTATAKSEAIKEFAEMLKEVILPQLGISTMEKSEAYYFCLDEIDNLVEEMVGESK
jgi:hypothetical protein